MNKTRIGFLIPVKIKHLTKRSLIYKLISNFSKYLDKGKYIYNFYIGFNSKDICALDTNIFKYLVNSSLSINIIRFNESLSPGHLTEMWNVLFLKSYNDNNDYFYQLGDDIIFDDYNFFDKYIEKLKSNNDLGVTGYLQKTNDTILTQSFVSRKHFKIFNFYFPKKIINWYCDNWISDIYRSVNLYFPLEKKLSNICSGQRYNAKINKDAYIEELNKYSIVLKKYLYINAKNHMLNV